MYTEKCVLAFLHAFGDGQHACMLLSTCMCVQKFRKRHLIHVAEGKVSWSWVAGTGHPLTGSDQILRTLQQLLRCQSHPNNKYIN